MRFGYEQMIDWGTGIKMVQENREAMKNIPFYLNPASANQKAVAPNWDYGAKKNTDSFPIIPVVIGVVIVGAGVFYFTKKRKKKKVA